ncbi:MAG: polysaccharide biosynthesis C-terminal domain-containing protein [Bacillota bacterium]|nr:polysaccharide biosynthesis C-terminal domain-containing protein [Bacillota bacterium]
MNFITDIIPMVIIALIGAFKIRLFLTNLGQETLGAYQLFAQIFMYLTLVEAGFGTAIMYKLYKPAKEQDLIKINQLLSGCRVIFNIVALVIFGIGLVLSFGLDLFIKDRTLDYGYIQIAFLLNLMANAVNYFFITFSIIYNINQKKYKTNLVTQALVITRSVIEIVLLTVGGDLIAITTLGLGFNLLIQVIIRWMAKREFPGLDVNVKDKDFSIRQDVKHILPLKITSLIGNNIDIIVISSFLGLGHVAVYTAYNYIVNTFRNIMNKFSDAALSSIGNLTVSDDKDDYAFFREYNSFIFFVSGILCVPLFLVLNPFIRLWVGETMMVSELTVFLFVAILFTAIIRAPAGSYITVYGLFKETKPAAYIEMLINLMLTLVLVHFFGITGVLAATVVAYLVSDPFRISPLYRVKFKCSPLLYYLEYLKYVALITVNGIAIFVLLRWIEPANSNLFSWLAVGSAMFVENLLVTYLLFKVFVKEFSFQQRLATLLRHVRKGG